MAPRPSFDYELEQLNQDLKKMGEMVENAIENAITAFKTQDHALARTIIAGDEKVNTIKKEIESRSFTLIMRQHPVAKDLRTVSTAIKIVTDMERIGDQAADIAHLILRIDGEHIYSMIEHIPDMAKNAKKMVHLAIDAFVSKDVDLADDVIAHDDVVDDLFNKVKNEVVRILKKENSFVDNGVDLLMIAKYLERIGDHAVNICEWVKFHQTGKLENSTLL